MAKTPNFDSFASQGTRFEQCHTTYTVCSQSRASFMTGVTLLLLSRPYLLPGHCSCDLDVTMVTRYIEWQ